MDDRINGCMVDRMDAWTNRRTDGRIYPNMSMQVATWAEEMNGRTYRWMTGETSGWPDKQSDGWTEYSFVRLIAVWMKEEEGRYWYYLVIYCRVLGPRPSLCLFVQVFFPRLVSIVPATFHTDSIYVIVPQEYIYWTEPHRARSTMLKSPTLSPCCFPLFMNSLFV